MELLTSLAIMLLCALFLGSICNKLKIPALLAFLIVGVALSPYALNLISPSILKVLSVEKKYKGALCLITCGMCGKLL